MDNTERKSIAGSMIGPLRRRRIWTKAFLHALSINIDNLRFSITCLVVRATKTWFSGDMNLHSESSLNIVFLGQNLPCNEAFWLFLDESFNQNPQNRTKLPLYSCRGAEMMAWIAICVHTPAFSCVSCETRTCTTSAGYAKTDVVKTKDKVLMATKLSTTLPVFEQNELW